MRAASSSEGSSVPGPAILQQLTDRAFMHIGILPQVDRRQRPAESPRGAQQARQAAHA